MFISTFDIINTAPHHAPASALLLTGRGSLLVASENKYMMRVDDHGAMNIKCRQNGIPLVDAVKQDCHEFQRSRNTQDTVRMWQKNIYT